MAWHQTTIGLRARSRGFHLITQEIADQLPQLHNYRVGIAHLFLLHTSAALALNEDADPTVRQDMEVHFNQMVPEDAPYYRHTYEGLDDMPAHIKAVLLGNSLTIPIANGRFVLGTWQGIYLCEHRNHAGQRRLMITLHGEMENKP
jgi:secondary thiamine-phosphate synthase enzyme